MRNLLISIAEWLGLLEPVFNNEPEILRRTELLTKAIISCKTYQQLYKIRTQFIPLFLTDMFTYEEVANCVSILNSHIGWKELELKQSFKHH